MSNSNTTTYVVCREHKDGSVYYFSEQYPTFKHAQVAAAQFLMVQHYDEPEDFEYFAKSIKVAKVIKEPIEESRLSNLNKEELKELLSSPIVG